MNDTEPTPFLSQREFSRRFRAARLARVEELTAIGIDKRAAIKQAAKEFSIYDLYEIDEEGRIRVAGLNLADPTKRNESA